MPFDIIGAKRAGFTDTEIAQEMAGKFGFDYSGARGAGFSDQEIIGEMLSKSDAGTTSAISPQPAHTPGARVTPETVGGKVKRIARAAAPTVRQTLQGVGATLGSLAGGGTALVAGQLGPQAFTPEEVATVPVGATTGGAIGYAGGKRLADIYDQAVGLQEAPQSLRDVSMRTLKDIGEGYAGEITGLGLGAGLAGLAKAPGAVARQIKRIPAPYRDQIDPETMRLARRAEAEGVKLSPAAVTGSRTLGLVEKGLDITPTTAGMVQNFKTQGVNAYRTNMVDPLMESMGAKGQTFVEAGKEAIDATARRSKVFDKIVSRKFNKARQLFPSEAGDIPVTQAQQTAQKIIGEEAKVLGSLQDREALAVLQEIAESPGMSFDAVQRNLSRMKEIIRSADRGLPTGTKFQSSSTAGAFKRIVKALEGDVDGFASQHGDEFLDAWKDAKQSARAGYELFDNKTIRRMLNAEPSQLVNYFRGKNTEALHTIKRAVGPKAFRDLRATWFESLVKETPDGKIRPASIAQALNKIDEGTARAIFSPQELKEVREIAKIGEMLQEGERIAGNPSGTAQTLMTPAYWSSIGATLLKGFANPAFFGVAAAELFGPPVMAKLYLSDAGRKYLTQGLRIKADSPAAGQWLKRVASYVDMPEIGQKLAEQYGKIKDKKK